MKNGVTVDREDIDFLLRLHRYVALLRRATDMCFNARGFEEFLQLCTMKLESLNIDLRTPSEKRVVDLRLIPIAGELQRWIHD